MDDTTSQVIDTNPAPVGASLEPAAPTVTEKAEPNWEEANDADLSAIFRKHNPERESDGKFAAPADATKLPDQAQTQEAEQPVAAISAPVSWSAEHKEAFKTLPPSMQQYVVQRDKETSEILSRQGNELSSFEPIKSVIEQHADIFERNGLEFSDGLGRLLGAERFLEQNPHAAIAQIAQAYGVDLRSYNGQQQPQNSAEQALHQRIAQLEDQLNDTTGRIQQREAHEAQTQLQSTTNLIEKFSADKPDWADLENDVHEAIIGIRAAIEQGVRPAMQPEQILSTAYERAQRNNPEAWAKKLDTDRKTEEAKKLSEAQKRADEAKRSKVVNITSSPASGRTVSSIDDTLRDSFRKAQTA